MKLRTRFFDRLFFLACKFAQWSFVAAKDSLGYHQYKEYVCKRLAIIPQAFEQVLYRMNKVPERNIIRIILIIKENDKAEFSFTYEPDRMTETTAIRLIKFSADSYAEQWEIAHGMKKDPASKSPQHGVSLDAESAGKEDMK